MMLIFKPETFGTKNNNSFEQENHDEPPIIRNSLIAVRNFFNVILFPITEIFHFGECISFFNKLETSFGIQVNRFTEYDPYEKELLLQNIFFLRTSNQNSGHEVEASITST